MKRTTDSMKNHLAHKIWLRFNDEYDGDMPERACLYWSDITVKVLGQHGIRALIQAGTCSWPRVWPEQDDGVSPTHLTFQWQPDDGASRFMMALGNMPEMHVWVGIPDHQEIVDMTTKYWPLLCQQSAKADWPGPKPPDFFWSHEPPDRVIYQADPLAITAALGLLSGCWEPDERGIRGAGPAVLAVLRN